MRKKISLLMLGVIAMLTSCSQGEDLLQVADGSQQTASVTFTVAVDAGMKTRAVGDDPDMADIGLKAYLVQEPESGTGIAPTVTEIPESKITKFGGSNEDYGFTISVDGLLEMTKYRLVFWASKAGDYTVEGNVATPATQTAPGIAFYGTTGDYALPSAMQTNIELKHAVAKVTLNSTTALTNDKTATLSVPTCTSFDIIGGTAATAEEAVVSTSEADAPAGNLCCVYVLCDGNGSTQTATVTLSNGLSNEVTNLPLKSNNHIKLTGDVDGIGVADAQTITVTLDGSWEESEQSLPHFAVDAESHTIEISRPGYLTAEAVTEAIGSGGTLLKVTGPMGSRDFAALAQYFSESDESARVDLDLSEASFRILPTHAFCNTENNTPARGLGTITLPMVCEEIESNAFSEDVEVKIVIAEGVKIVRNTFINNGKVEKIVFGSALATMEDIAICCPHSHLTVDLSKLTNEVSIENDNGYGIFYNPSMYNPTNSIITVLVANEAMQKFFVKYQNGNVGINVKE